MSFHSFVGITFIASIINITFVGFGSQEDWITANIQTYVGWLTDEEKMKLNIS